MAPSRVRARTVIRCVTGSSRPSTAAMYASTARTGVSTRPRVASMPVTAPRKCVRSMASLPPAPTYTFLSWPAMPATSWGTSCPMERIRSQRPSTSCRATSQRIGVSTRPPDTSRTKAAGTSPRETTPLRNE